MICDIVRLIRIKHWIKNLFVFAPLIFSLRFLDIRLILSSFGAFFIFSLTSSLTYIINDIVDRKKDREHPVKKNRPLAGGRIKVHTAVIIALIIFLILILFTSRFSLMFILVILLYFTSSLFYTLLLKHIVIIDVFFIAAGFVLRVMAGAAAIEVVISSWIILCTFFLSLFLGFGKRRNDLHLHRENHEKHRPVLKEYNVQYLDYMIIISLTLTIISYSLYVVDTETIIKLGTDKLIYTIPLVLYGVFKYMHILYKKEELADPAEIILKDKSILLCILLWGILVAVILYLENFFRRSVL